jgi:hypothetical protein
MDELDEQYLLESPLLKIVLLKKERTEHVNPIFGSRDEKGEFELLFKDLSDQPERFFLIFSDGTSNI